MNEAFTLLFTPAVLFAVAIGTLAGIIVGGMPGLTATMAVALLIPTTFSLDPAVGLVLMGGVYCGAMYGGSIPAILLKTPGTPAAIATSLEGYPMTQQGKGGQALKVSVIASFSGGMFSAFILLISAPLLAKFALRFGPPEYFLLALMGLAGIVSLTDEDSSLFKALIAGLLGMIIATVGTDPISGSLRYTLQIRDLYDGVAFMPALIGLFSIIQMMELAGQQNHKVETNSLKTIKREPMPKGMGKYIALGSGVGTVVGVLPGEGATIAAFLSYNVARRFSKFKSLFGKGNPEGIAAAESGNNGCVGGSLVPTLTMGIPGNSVAAALMGGLIIHGLIPGPELFTTHATTTYSFIFSLFLANIVLLIVGLTFAPYFARVSLIPPAILIPVVCVFSVIGSYAINGSVFDVFVMLAFAFVGYFLQKGGFSLGALILGLILGPIAETGFAQGMIMGKGSPMIFFERIESQVLWAIILALLIPPLYSHYKQHRKSHQK